MRKIVYYVATSLDGYISGPGGRIDGYVTQSSGIDQYLSDLKAFDTVIMGKNTYEFGFPYGVVPGMPAYEHMEHYIFSESASYPNSHEQVKIVPRDIEIVRDLKNADGSEIYLCGGGIFAGWLLEHELIDILKIKLNPVIFSGGLRLFGDSRKMVKMDLLSQEQYDHGLMIITYKLKYE